MHRACFRALRCGLAAALVLAAAPASAGDAVRTNDAAGREPAGATASPQPAGKPDPRKLAEWYRQAMELLQKKEYAKAIEPCERILAVEPQNALMLYNAACAYAVSGDKARALERLRKAVENGFVSFGHMARDPDLDSLRQESVYKELFDRKEEFVRQARERAVRQITERLAWQKIDARVYKAVYDGERNLVYLHAQADEDFATVRKGLEEFADGLWATLFDHKPEQPLYIVLLTAQDSPKAMPRGVGGFFSNGANTLFCGERPASSLLQASIVRHEFTHGLHFADQAVRSQTHPIWLVEGLSTLFESSRLENGRLTPLPSFRMAVVQQAIKGSQSVPWEMFVKLNHPQFVGNANLCYAQARCMLLYLHETGRLKAFYDEYTRASSYAGDASALEAFEVVFGQPATAVERTWKEWALEQPVPTVPFLGVIAEEREQRLAVKSVVGKSPAALAGIRKGDTIVTLEGSPVFTRDDLMEAVSTRHVGDELDIRLERAGRPMAVTAKLAERPEVSMPLPDVPQRAADQAVYTGLAVSESEGEVRVRDVDPDSPAAKAGMEPGWRILTFDAAETGTVREFLAAVKKAKPGQTVELRVRKPDGQEAAVKLAVEVDPTVASESK